MTPAARLQAAIEIVDGVIEAARSNGPPADRLIADYFRQRRYAGSKDRRAVRELVYGAVRACGPVPPSGRAALLRLAGTVPDIRLLFDGSVHGAAPIVPGEDIAEGGIAPDWLVRRLEASGIAGEEAAALLGRAPLDLRVNTLKSRRDELALPVPAEALAAPQGLRLPHGTPVEQWDCHRDGLVEVQDHGSQWAALAVGARPGETVLDLCAGAGGKTLALAAMMENAGVLVASDTDRRRLGRLPERAARAGAANIQPVLLNPGEEITALGRWHGKADAVLVDAPCSGTGTWRRNPEQRWRMTPTDLQRLTQLQARLIDVAAKLVRPGGRIVYVTCSLLDEEGVAQAAAACERGLAPLAPRQDLPLGRQHGLGTRLTPHHDATDGFFIAQLGSA